MMVGRFRQSHQRARPVAAHPHQKKPSHLRVPTETRSRSKPAGAKQPKTHHVSKQSLFSSREGQPLRNQQIKDSLRRHKETQKEGSGSSGGRKKQKRQYEQPNGEYFGDQTSLSRQLDRERAGQGKQPRKSSLSSMSANQRKKGSKSKRRREEELCSSLGRKVREFRRMEAEHRRESSSLSNASERERHRLAKLQSIEKMQLMEEIIGMEEALGPRRR